MLGYLLSAVAGAVAFYLILRNNPKLAEKVLNIVNRIDEEIKKK